MKEVEIWTDGASKGNPGPGGWGAWMKYKGHVLELCGGALITIYYQMELTAPTEALWRFPAYFDPSVDPRRHSLFGVINVCVPRKYAKVFLMKQ